MLPLALVFAALSALLSLGFIRKYQARLHHDAHGSARYHRIADYYGRPIALAFDYREGKNGAPASVEADVDEIYHYGRDYFLKGRSPDGKRSLVYKWSRIANPRARHDGRAIGTLEDLFQSDEGGARAAA